MTPEFYDRQSAFKTTFDLSGHENDKTFISKDELFIRVFP